MKLPFNIDLKDKVCVVTGGTGILCGAMADALAECGAKVAILALGQEACDNKAKEINEKGGIAIGIDANVLDKESLKKAHEIINKELGPVDILINGAGGNHPKGTTTKEYLEIEDLENEELTTFFDLDPKGVEFVFNLNFLGTLLYLVSEEASGFVNGVVIPVDGAFSAYSGV